MGAGFRRRQKLQGAMLGIWATLLCWCAVMTHKPKRSPHTVRKRTIRRLYQPPDLSTRSRPLTACLLIMSYPKLLVIAGQGSPFRPLAAECSARRSIAPTLRSVWTGRTPPRHRRAYMAPSVTNKRELSPSHPADAHLHLVWIIGTGTIPRNVRPFA